MYLTGFFIGNLSLFKSNEYNYLQKNAVDEEQ